MLGYFIALGSGLTLSLDMKCCTMLICTPSVAGILLGDETDNIRVMVVGGEACIQGLETKVETFINGYGPTEASIWCTGGNKPDTIGFPLPNTLCYVVHPDDGTLCPPGVSGELWVGGIGVGTIPYLSTFHLPPSTFTFHLHPPPSTLLSIYHLW